MSLSDPSNPPLKSPLPSEITSTIADPTTSSPPAAHNYKFNISMSCGGCSGAITKVLQKLDGVQSFTVDRKGQTAEVNTESLSYKDVLAKLKKTGKSVNRGEADGVEMSVDLE